EAMGYRVMRFWNHEILSELDIVLEQIYTALIESPSPQPFYALGVLPEVEGARLQSYPQIFPKSQITNEYVSNVSN
ncbi:MAG TPA: DUF559 domain-containing protein, partial [Acidiferrobacteraceae bacterium]|nr:DUF559 domain-containing protein [Acidiferrobacteraceae bacterium]